MPSYAIRSLADCVMVQHDFQGEAIFQHRNRQKWTLYRTNRVLRGFMWEQECHGFVEELRQKWSKALPLPDRTLEQKLMEQICDCRTYLYIRIGFDYRAVELLPDGSIRHGSARLERNWAVTSINGRPVLRLSGEADVICELTPDEDGVFSGYWLKFERMPIRLVPLD